MVACALHSAACMVLPSSAYEVNQDTPSCAPSTSPTRVWSMLTLDRMPCAPAPALKLQRSGLQAVVGLRGDLEVKPRRPECKVRGEVLVCDEVRA